MVVEPINRNDSATITGFLHRLDQCIAAHPRISITYTPKHASWLDMAELWFSVLTRGLLRRGEFTSRADLAEKITGFAIRHNRTRLGGDPRRFRSVRHRDRRPSAE